MSRRLAADERRRLALLGLPTFALGLSITVVSTYLPTVARRFTGSTTVIGVMIGGEGLGALLLPVIVGAWSDRLRTRWGGRLPFVIAGTPIAAVGLAAMGLISRRVGRRAFAHHGRPERPALPAIAPTRGRSRKRCLAPSRRAHHGNATQ